MTSCFTGDRPGLTGGSALRSLYGSFVILFAFGFVPVRTALAVEVRPPEFAELVQVSDYIIRAKVAAKECVWEGTEPHRQIFTLFTIDVLETLAGQAPEPLVLKTLGGEIGNESMRIEGVTELAVGSEYVLFVRGNGRQFFPLVAMMHGMYPVVRYDDSDGAVVARANGDLLRSTAEVAAPLSHAEAEADAAEAALPPLTVEQFAQQIRAAAEEGAQ